MFLSLLCNIDGMYMHARPSTCEEAKMTKFQLSEVLPRSYHLPGQWAGQYVKVILILTVGAGRPG